MLQLLATSRSTVHYDGGIDEHLLADNNKIEPMKASVSNSSENLLSTAAVELDGEVNKLLTKLRRETVSMTHLLVAILLIAYTIWDKPKLTHEEIVLAAADVLVSTMAVAAPIVWNKKFSRLLKTKRPRF